MPPAAGTAAISSSGAFTTSRGCPVVSLHARLPGMHWWYNTASHAPELTAGYYNTASREGYLPVRAPGRAGEGSSREGRRFGGWGGGGGRQGVPRRVDVIARGFHAAHCCHHPCQMGPACLPTCASCPTATDCPAASTAAAAVQVMSMLGKHGVGVRLRSAELRNNELMPQVCEGEGWQGMGMGHGMEGGPGGAGARGAATRQGGQKAQPVLSLSVGLPPGAEPTVARHHPCTSWLLLLLLLLLGPTPHPPNPPVAAPPRPCATPRSSSPCSALSPPRCWCR